MKVVFTGTANCSVIVPAFSTCHRPHCICLPQPEKHHTCPCSQHNCTENASVIARPVPTTTGNTGMVRPMLRHTTHGTDSDQLIKPVSKEPGINPLRFQV
uniref:Uncharacterized protein n=1 Tax=Arundo donax TaxID=35708 RepID=A0A0A9FT05_ARUDO